MGKNIILLGAPGAGKGTQAVAIAETFKIPHISTGDIFRKNIKEGTPIGLKAKSYIDAGKLVPDEVVIAIVEGRIKEDDCKNGYLLDGFPRTLDQAAALDKVTDVTAVVNLDIDLNLLMKRLTGRRVCKACGASTHIDFMKGDACACGDNWIQRDDDKEETVKSRLGVYTAQTQPLIAYYGKQNKLLTVDAGRSIADVGADVIKALKAL